MGLRSVTAVNVTEKGEGDFRRLHLEWTDPDGSRQVSMLSGYSYAQVSGELDRQTAAGPDARNGFLTGLALATSLGER